MGDVREFWGLDSGGTGAHATISLFVENECREGNPHPHRNGTAVLSPSESEFLMTYGPVMPIFYNRSMHDLIATPAGVQWSTRRFSHRAIGGPHRANVVAVGGVDALVGLLDYLRYPIELIDGQGVLCWWGYVHEVKIRLGAMEVGVTLDRMYNRIKVKYTVLTVGEEGTSEAVTGFGDNGTSQNLYGRKEIVLDAGNLILDEIGAEQLRDTRLGGIGLPLALAEFTNSTAAQVTAELFCRGWWETLGWQLYSQAAGRLNYLTTKGGAFQGIGQSATATATDVTWEDGDDGDFIYSISGQFLRYSAGQIITVTSSTANDGTYTILEVNANGQRITTVEDVDDDGSVDSITITPQGTKGAQSFATGASDTWSTLTVAVRAKKVGSPSDNLEIGLYSNSAGSPGTKLASGFIAGADLDDVVRWRSAEVIYALAASTTYWVVVERSGSSDADDCYHVELDTEAGASGSYKYWDGSAWQSRGGVDMPFDVVGGSTTTAMISEALGEAQFVGDVAIRNTSGITTALYQAEEQTIKQAVETWLEMGTLNDRRLLAAVDRGRNVQIYEEPKSSELNYRKRADGSITTDKGVRVEPQRFTAGVWLVGEALETAVPPGTRLASVARSFIEESEWTSDDKVRLVTKGTKPVWEL